MNPDKGESSDQNVQVVKGWQRIVYLCGAMIFFALGCAGLALPGLPGTPFFLLTSYLLVRSSPRLNQRLLDSRIIGPMLTDWQTHGGIKLHIKLKAIGVVVTVVSASIYFTTIAGWLKGLIAIVATVGIVVIWLLPTTKTSDDAHN